MLLDVSLKFVKSTQLCLSLLARKPRKRPPHLPSRRPASAPHARHIPQRPGWIIESCHSRTAWKHRVGNRGQNRGQKTETEVRPAQPSPSSTPLHLPRDSMAFSNSSTSFQIRLASRQAQEPFFDMFHPCNLATLLIRPRSPTWPPASA